MFRNLKIWYTIDRVAERNKQKGGSTVSSIVTFDNLNDRDVEKEYKICIHSVDTKMHDILDLTIEGEYKNFDRFISKYLQNPQVMINIIDLLDFERHPDKHLDLRYNPGFTALICEMNSTIEAVQKRIVDIIKSDAFSELLMERIKCALLDLSASQVKTDKKDVED